MKSRMKNPVLIIPEAMQAMYALNTVVDKSGLPRELVWLVQLRASQINGCAVCLDMHARIMQHGGETDERINAVAAWHDAPYYTDAERAALALTEALTRMADRTDPIPDEVWQPAARQFNEVELSGLILAVSVICADTAHRPDWEWLKWLPHALHPTRTDALGQLRLISESVTGLA